MGRQTSLIRAGGGGRRRWPTRAFTLIELLLVISIIGLLLTILLPAFWRMRLSARATASAARVQGLADGAEQYFLTYRKVYPGTDKVSRADLKSGKFHGSQILALRLFGLSDTGTFLKDAPKLVPYNEKEVLAEVGGRKWTLVDAFGEDTPILYYPARKEFSLVTNTGTDSMYVYNDNKDYILNDDGVVVDQSTQFRNSVADMSNVGKGQPYRSDYILISAGIDQVFLTSDDAMNYKR